VGIVLAAAVLAAALVWLALGRRSRLQAAPGGAGRRAGHVRPAQAAALMLVALGLGFFLLFAIAELAGGDVAGVQHLPPAAVLGALLWLGRKRPRTAGVALLALAVPSGVALVVGVRPGELWVALPIPLVAVLTGVLFLQAGRSERRHTSPVVSPDAQDRRFPCPLGVRRRRV
jgi:hypothetical protein